MLGQIKNRLSYANVVASLALFVALGGTSYAAVTLSKNSVRSKHIKNGQVKSADLGKNAVVSAKVKDQSLLARDFRPGQLPAGPPGAPGATGATGATGAVGATGNTGPEGTAVAYATVNSGGQVVGAAKNITQANIDPDTQPGYVCFRNLPFAVKSAITVASGSDGPDVLVTPTVITDGGDLSAGDCRGTVIVTTFDIGNNAVGDRSFRIWFED